MNTKSAAIQPDKLDDITLDKLSATQFIEALQAKKAIDLVRFWPEKKKYELEEQFDYQNVRLKDFVGVVNNINNAKIKEKEIRDKIMSDKKKVERELAPGLFSQFGPTPEPSRVLQLQLDQLSTQVQSLTNQIAGMK